MNPIWLRLLQACLWFICACHVIIGLGINVSRPFMETAADCYGATVDFTPQLVAILHPLGAFMLILGVFAAVAASNPLRYRAIVYGFVALFLIRTVQRIVFASDIERAFGITATRNLLTIGFFLILGIGLAALQLYVESRQAAVVR